VKEFINAEKRRMVALVMSAIFALAVCQEGNSMGIKASKVNPDRYFSDPKVVAFVNDVQDGNMPKVNDAIRAGMNVNVEGQQGFRPLFFIFPAANADVAKALLAAGADPNARLPEGATPLYYAVRFQNTGFTQALLAARADPNAKVENDKPIIHEAVLAGEAEQIKLLAKAGANINAVWGSTPLYAALEASTFGAATALLDLGADTNWRSPGGKTQYTAGELFCSFAPRMQPTAKNKKDIQALFESFARRGVSLSCKAEAERFR
jgi:ankyrin repeat protein